jgi:hypothetical protein
MQVNFVKNEENGQYEVRVVKPNIQRNEEGKVIGLGSCYVDGDKLDCYNWENEDTLLIFDKIDASEEALPVKQYYCFNVNKNENGWVTRDQVKFELESLFGEPYRLKEV